ncbi:MAG TPA: hypothetical protein VJY54_04390 [Lachnospiraceae bacterium]|nr:hypothetical protein [Lachnospiraceae bacterium]
MIVDDDFFQNMDITKVDYASGVILPDGRYVLTKEGHLQTLFMIADMPKDKIWEMIPKDDSPLFFMIAYTHCIITDNNSTVGMKMTKEQEKTYGLLVSHGIIEDKYFDISNERKKVNLYK